MFSVNFIVALFGLLALDVVSAYYQPILQYGVADPAAARYLLPAYVPSYATYPVKAPIANNDAHYSGGPVKHQQQQQKYDDHDTKYYYGGKFQGVCSNDGLYYKDDATFVICSNGYASEQPCPPGTKTGGSPNYQAGYYYGYTDLCSVNLVDYGYGPSSYTDHRKESAQLPYKEHDDIKKEYNSYRKEAYSTPKVASYPAVTHSVDSYPSNKPAYPSNGAYPAASAAYVPKNPYAAVHRDSAGYEIKEAYPEAYPAVKSYHSTGSSYTTKNAYPVTSSGSHETRDAYSSSSAGSNPYVSRDTIYPSHRDSAYPSSDVYQPKNAYPSKDTSYETYPPKDTAAYPAKDTAYAPKDDYVKAKYPAYENSEYSSQEKRY